MIDATTTHHERRVVQAGATGVPFGRGRGQGRPGARVGGGDSIWDIQAARAAGTGCIRCETGGFSRHEPGEAAPCTSTATSKRYWPNSYRICGVFSLDPATDARTAPDDRSTLTGFSHDVFR